MTEFIRTYLKKLLLLPCLCISLYVHAGTAHDFHFVTDVAYPNIFKSKIFSPLHNRDHKLLFYTGSDHGENVTGYYRSSDFLGFKEYKFAPFEYYHQYKNKTLNDVASGAGNSTIALSTIDGLGQILSTTSDGKSWVSQKINLSNRLFDKLTTTKTHNIKGVAVYHSTQTALLTSYGDYQWQLWAFPNTCSNEDKEYCSIVNNYFTSQYDQYLLLQTRELDGIKTNKLYKTSNLTDWYSVDVPFGRQTVQKTFNDSKHDIMLASVLDKDSNHLLWVSSDLYNWQEFNLPNDAKISDLKVYDNDQIALLLVSQKHDSTPHLGEFCDCGCDCHHGCECPTDCKCYYQPYTDLAVLDTKTGKLQVLYNFKGEVNSINFYNNKLYLSGSFVNGEDDSHAALVSINTKLV